MLVLELQTVIEYLLTIPEGKLTSEKRICTALGGELPVLFYWCRQITDDLWEPYWRVVSESGRLLHDFGMDLKARHIRLVQKGVELRWFAP